MRILRLPLRLSLVGFTLVELLLVFSIMSIMAAFGISAYRDYVDTRRVSVAADEYASVLATAKSRAISQVKPAACGSAELEGYRVVTCPGGCSANTVHTYKMEAVCDISPAVDGVQVGAIYRLPQGVTFAVTSQQNVLFRTLTGAAVSSGNVIIQSGAKSKTVSINSAGLIAMSGLGLITPTAAPTTPPTPTTPPAPLTLSFSATQTSIPYNTATNLNWTSGGSVSFCDASGGWSGSKGLTGSESTGLLTTTTVYTLRCQGSGGDETRNVTVTVGPSPASITSFTANPSTVAYNAASSLSWSSTNATSCSGTNGANGWAGTGKPVTSSGTTTGSLTNTTLFTLTCTGAGGSSSPQSVTVSVADPSGTVYPAYANPSAQTQEAGSNQWKNTHVAAVQFMSIVQVGMYVTGGSGNYSWQFRSSDSSGSVTGAILRSGTLSPTPNANGYYTQNITAQSLSPGTYYLFRVLLPNGTAYRGGQVITSPLYFMNYSTDNNIANTAGSYAVRFIYP